MAQRSIEILIGRLLTDEAFRNAFLKDMFAALVGFMEAGHELTTIEMAAVSAIPPGFWNRTAEEIDSRLQKASLAVRGEGGQTS